MENSSLKINDLTRFWKTHQRGHLNLRTPSSQSCVGGDVMLAGASSTHESPFSLTPARDPAPSRGGNDGCYDGFLSGAFATHPSREAEFGIPPKPAQRRGASAWVVYRWPLSQRPFFNHSFAKRRHDSQIGEHDSRLPPGPRGRTRRPRRNHRRVLLPSRDANQRLGDPIPWC